MTIPAMAIAQHSIPHDALTTVGECRRSFYSINPATMNVRDTTSFSRAGLMGELYRPSKYMPVQTGGNRHDITLGADSYLKLSQESSVWGHAAFTTGVTDDVAEANCIDYLLLAPYVTGDNVGGKLTHKTYRFGGGWSRNFNGWHAGLQAAYRAVIAHRAHDPRVKDIVSDLTLDIGVAHSLGYRYMLGLSAGMRIYNQDSDVDFYNPAGTILTQVYTGLGSTYSRFDNSQADEAAYRLYGYRASLQLLPASPYHHGWRGDITWNRMQSKLFLRDFNNLTLGVTTTSAISGYIGWYTSLSKQVSFLPHLQVTDIMRDGVENLFGSSTSGTYDKVGERPNYKCTAMASLLSLPIEWHSHHNRVTLSASPKGGYCSVEQKLRQSDVKKDFNKYIAGGRVSATVHVISLFNISAQASYYNITGFTSQVKLLLAF